MVNVNTNDTNNNDDVDSSVFRNTEGKMLVAAAVVAAAVSSCDTFRSTVHHNNRFEAHPGPNSIEMPLVDANVSCE